MAQALRGDETYSSGSSSSSSGGNKIKYGSYVVASDGAALNDDRLPEDRFHILPKGVDQYSGRAIVNESGGDGGYGLDGPVGTGVLTKESDDDELPEDRSSSSSSLCC